VVKNTNNAVESKNIKVIDEYEVRNNEL